MNIPENIEFMEYLYLTGQEVPYIYEVLIEMQLMAGNYGLYNLFY